MRLPHSRGSRSIPLEVPMTPMIDVIFQLLIFFVCTASFHAGEELLPTSLVGGSSHSQEPPADPEKADLEQVVVKIRQEAGRTRWNVNQQDLKDWNKVRDLIQSVAAVGSDLRVILDAEGEVPLEKVVDVYDLCRMKGLRNIQFAADQTAP